LKTTVDHSKVFEIIAPGTSSSPSCHSA
jgi:hypothetical protein